MIDSDSQIVISSKASITGSGRGLSASSTSFNPEFFKFGGFIETEQNEAVKMSAYGGGGGVIALISSDGVMNNGSMECKALDHNLFSGGTIMISTDGHECGPGGVAIVECAQFIDNGILTPRPDVVIGSTENAVIQWIRGMDSEQIEESMMRTKMKDHRGSRTVEVIGITGVVEMRFYELMEDQRQWMEAEMTVDALYAVFDDVIVEMYRLMECSLLRSVKSDDFLLLKEKVLRESHGH